MKLAALLFFALILLPTSAPTAAETAHSLSQEQIKRLRSAMAKYGHDFVIREQIANALSLPSTAATTPVRQLAIKDAVGFAHVIYFLPWEGKLLLATVDEHEGRNYLIGSDFKVLATVIMIGGKASGAIPPAEAQSSVQTLLAYWGNVTDRLPAE